LHDKSDAEDAQGPSTAALILAKRKTRWSQTQMTSNGVEKRFDILKFGILSAHTDLGPVPIHETPWNKLQKGIPLNDKEAIDPIHWDDSRLILTHLGHSDVALAHRECILNTLVRQEIILIHLGHDMGL
jgi:hypothetical protein